jgi:polyisoprenoid-binding protein YceI
MKRLVLIIATLLASASLALAADTYQIDGAHSSANFTVKHMAISTVHGRFTTVNGTILLDEKSPEKSSVTAVIKSTSVNTDNSMRDRHLNSPDFFDTAQYPELRFQSTRIRPLGGDSYIAVGNLTIKDVTRQVEIPYTLTRGKGMRGEARLGVEGALTINRFDYHVSYDSTGVTVSKDIKIELSVEAAAAPSGNSQGR